MVFGTVIDETDKATKHLTLFGQEWSKIKVDFKTSDTKGISKISTALKGLKLQAIGAELATAALNAALTLGLSLAVNAAVKGISKLLNKEKEAAAEAERLQQERDARRQQLTADIKAYDEENKAIDTLVNNYVSLVASTSDITSVKSELVDIQDELIAKYGSEAEGLDLVNGKLSDNIRLLSEAENQRNNAWISENRTAINEAKDYFKDYDYALAGYHTTEKFAQEEARMHFEYLMKEIEKADLSQYIIGREETYVDSDIGETISSYTFALREGLNPEEVEKAATAFRDLYGSMQDWETLNTDYLSDNGMEDLEYLDELVKKITEYKSALDYVKEANDNTWDYDAARAEVGEQFDTLIDKAQELSNKINSPESSNAAIYGYSMELQDVEKEIDDIVAKYPALADNAKLIFDGLKTEIKSTIGDAETLRQAFIKTFDDTHKDALGNIDKVEKAMQSMLKAEGLKFDDFKSLAWDIDTEGILRDVKEIGGAYYLSDSELIKLKDAIIEKQIQSIELGKEDAKTNLENARRELSRLKGEFKELAPNGMFPIADARANRDAIELSKKIKTLEDSVGAYSDEIKRSDQLIREYRSHMGDLATTAGMLQARIDGLKKSQDALKDSISKLETDASDYLKAQEAVIDKITDKQEREKEVLEEQLDALNDQLEVLEAQENELNTIIDNYKSVANIVGDAIQSQIDELEKNKQSIEDYYNEQISKLKEQNEERQDAIDLAEKLAALENAKNNKVRSYSSATGWTYQTNKDALNQATNALDDAKTEKQIKELEKQRDAATADYDKQIDGYEDYAKEWEKISKSIESEEDERLAQQILGSEWREKISKKDTAILTKYNTDFRNYNSQLNSLVGVEMRSLKKSIEAKNSEIKAKQDQIDSWKKYKTEVQRAANDLKAVQEGYIKFINQVALDENSSWQDREKNLLNFKNTYKTYMNEIVTKNGELQSVTDRINGLTEALNNMGNIDLSGIDSLEAEIVAMEAYADSIKSIQDRLAQSSTGYGIVNSAGDARLVNASYSDVQEQIKWLEALLKNLRGYSTGGAVTHTGLAMLHGSQSGAEVVFNASQAKKLYEYVDQTPNLITAALNEALHLTRGNISSPASGTNVAVTIDRMVVEANNPEDFSKQFKANIDRYIQTEFTKSQVYSR